MYGSTSKIKYRHKSWAFKPLFLLQKEQLYLTPLAPIRVDVMPELVTCQKIEMSRHSK